jgi:hypothetical protein
MYKVAVAAAVTAIVIAASVLADTSTPPPEGMVQPAYDNAGALIRPEGYREWIFVGSSLGLSYSKPNPDQVGPGIFHHIYIQPQAYKHYTETGTFPEKTMLVMENYTAGSKEDNTAKELTKDKEEFENLNGHFEDQRTGVEVALKDSERFEDSWAYFNFSTRAGLLAAAKPFPKAACWDCHNAHAAVDNVFVQFYPILRESRTNSH